MESTIERTSADRMTDMYVLRMHGLRQIPSRFLCFTQSEWEKMYPALKLNRGEKRKICLTFEENGV